MVTQIDTKNEESSSSWLSFANMSDAYERKANFIPGVLTFLVIAPLFAAWGSSLLTPANTLIAGVGIGAVFAVALSYLSSLMGNRIQLKLWPNWPHDAPTHTRLHPQRSSCSESQIKQWYKSIKRLTNDDIQKACDSGNDEEINRVINDAVKRVRSILYKSDHGELLKIHLTDYGFARNLTGLRPIWLLLGLISLIGSWAAYILGYQTSLLWPLVSAGVFVFSLPLAFSLLPGFVRQKADYYADSFFNALEALVEAKWPKAQQSD